MNQTEQLNKNTIFQDFQKELSDFQKQVEKKESGGDTNIDYEKYEKFLYNGISQLSEAKLDDADKAMFLEIKSILLDKEKQVSSEQLKKLGEILIKFEAKDITESELEQMKTSIEQIQKTKQDLRTLQQDIVPGNLTQKEQEVKKKIESYKERLKGFSKEHPIWTKALILLLPANLAILFKKQNIQAELGGAMTENSGPLGQVKDILGNLKQYFSFANDWIAQIAVMFFSLPFIGAPKQMQELLADMKKDLKNIDVSLLKKLGVNMEGVVENIKDKDLTPEQKENSLNIVDKKIRGYIPDMIKKVSGKELKQGELDEIMKEINLRDFFKNDTEELKKLSDYFKNHEENDANYLKAGIEGITLPFKLFFRIFSILKKRNYVSYTDLGVNFTKKTGDIFLGTFGLMGSGVSLLEGKIDEDTFKENIKDMFETSPDAAKEILAIMLYRHGGIVFSTLGEISNFIGKSLIYSLSGETSLKNTIVSGLKGNIDEYVRVLKKINSVVPNNLKINGIDILEKTVNELEEANNIVKLLLDNKGKNISGLQFIEEYKRQFGKRPEILGDISNIGPESLRSTISGRLSSLGEGLDRQISLLSSSLGKNFKGITSSSYLLDDLSKHIKDTTSYLSDVVKNDNLFNNIRSQLKKIGLTANMMEIDPLYDKLVFKLQTPKDAKEFFGKLIKLAKQSPELLRFIFDKTPIFLVAGLSATNEDSLEEFGKQLLYLVPFFGSGYMLMDSMYVNKPDLVQAGISTILLGTETGYVAYKLATHGFKNGGKDVLNYILKPGKDVIEIAGFLSKSLFISGKIAGDGLYLLSKGKLNISELKNFMEKFPKLEGKGKLGFLLLVGVLGYEFAFAGESELEQFTKNCKKDGKLSTECLDKKIKEEWVNLSNDEKAEFMAFAYGLRTGKVDGIEGEYEDGKYKIKLNENYGAIPNYYRKKEIESNIKSILARKYGEDNINIEVYFKKSLIDKVFKDNKLITEEDKISYLKALGYSDDVVEKIINI